MFLENTFTDNADNKGPFVANIEFETSGTIAEKKRRFRHHAQRACYELGIVAGVKETDKGFMLGFENRDDYVALMDNVEPVMLAQEAKFQAHIEKLAREHGEWFRCIAQAREAQKAGNPSEARSWFMEADRADRKQGATTDDQPLTAREEAILDSYR